MNKIAKQILINLVSGVVTAVVVVLGLVAVGAIIYPKIAPTIISLKAAASNLSATTSGFTLLHPTHKHNNSVSTPSSKQTQNSHKN